MRKVVLFIACSLDGYIAGPNDELDWLFAATGEDYGYESFISTVDTLLMGRRTWEITKTFGDWPYGQRTGFVFSQTAAEQDEGPVRWTSRTPEKVRT